jgi:hypothetical protein
MNENTHRVTVYIFGGGEATFDGSHNDCIVLIDGAISVGYVPIHEGKIVPNAQPDFAEIHPTTNVDHFKLEKL